MRLEKGVVSEGFEGEGMGGFTGGGWRVGSEESIVVLLLLGGFRAYR